MVLPILIYNHPLLRKKCLDLDRDYHGLTQLIDNIKKLIEKISSSERQIVNIL